MKLKRRGYILFVYWSGGGTYIETGYEFYDNKKRLMSAHYSHVDDKWDVKGRDKIHYFYLDIAKGKYYPLPKWAKDFAPELGYEQSELKVLSTKTF